MTEPYRPCAGCDSVGESCRQIQCPATRGSNEPDTGDPEHWQAMFDDDYPDFTFVVTSDAGDQS